MVGGGRPSTFCFGFSDLPTQTKKTRGWSASADHDGEKARAGALRRRIGGFGCDPAGRSIGCRHSGRIGLQIEDSFTVDAPLERVWSMITDPEVVGPCIPGCQQIEVTGPDTYKADIKVAVGPIKTTFTVTVEKTEERPPHFAASTTKGEEGGRASTLNATQHAVPRGSRGQDRNRLRVGRFGFRPPRQVRPRRDEEEGPRHRADFRGNLSGKG